MQLEKIRPVFFKFFLLGRTELHRTDLEFSIFLSGGGGGSIRLPVSEVPKTPGVNRIN